VSCPHRMAVILRPTPPVQPSATNRTSLVRTSGTTPDGTDTYADVT
jgi:hypothetical protein